MLNGSVKNKTINNIALNKIAKQASEREKQQFFNKTKAKTNFVFASPHDKRRTAGGSGSGGDGDSDVGSGVASLAAQASIHYNRFHS